MRQYICSECRIIFEADWPEDGPWDSVCRICRVERIKASIISSLPKYEKPNTEASDLKETWLIPDKEKKYDT